MYFVPTEYNRPLRPRTKRESKRSIPPRPRCQRPTNSTHTEWIKLRTKHREAELRRNGRTKKIADYMKQIMYAATIPPPPISNIQLPKLKGISSLGSLPDMTVASVAADTHTRPSKEIIYETPKREPVGEDEYDYEEEFLE